MSFLPIFTIFVSLSVALSCDCGFMDAMGCGTKIVSCVSSCKGGLSSGCTDCLKGLGKTCCNCVGKGVGEVNGSFGNAICDHCGLLGSAAEPAAEAAGTCQFSAENACANSPANQKAACLVGMSRDLASQAVKLGYRVPLRKHSVVTSSGKVVHFSQHELGCSFLNPACWFNKGKCTICKKTVPTLAKMGSKGLCSAGCVAAVEAAGGGPGDPIADVVAFACPLICGQIFSAGAGAAADTVCRSAHMC